MHCVSVYYVYLVLLADYLRGRQGPSFHLCRSPQTGSGPPPRQMCLLYCRKALRTGKRRHNSSGSISGDINPDKKYLGEIKSGLIKACAWFTSQTVSHEDLVSQRVTQHHANKLPVPCPLDVLAALAAAVSRVVLEGEGNPNRFTTCGATEIEHLVVPGKYLSYK